jgi:hypothetical protein
MKVPKRHSIPIASSIRRKRQRLPSCLLIENASARNFASSPRLSCAEAFPIKASDDPLGEDNQQVGRCAPVSLAQLA